MAIKAKMITLDANGKVVLTPLEAGTVYTPGWRWFEWRGQLWLAERIDRMGNMMLAEPVNSEGLSAEIDRETGSAFMVLSPGPDKSGAEELHIPAVKHSFRVSTPDGPGLRWWYTAEVAGIQLLGAGSWLQLDFEYALRLEHLATQSELILAERAEQERRRAAQEVEERKENQTIQAAVVSVKASDLIQLVKCWPHLKCRKPNVNRVEMERVVSRWARSKGFNVHKAVSAAEPFYQNWRDELLGHREIPVEEIATIPPQDVNLVEDFAIGLDSPASVESKPIEPESYLRDLAPDTTSNQVFGPPVVVESGGRSGFLDPVPTAVGLAGSGSRIRYEALLEDLLGTSGALLGLNDDGASQILAALSSDGEIRQSLADELEVDFELLLDVIDSHRVEVPNKKSA